MPYTASHRFARIAPRKAQLVAALIRGQQVDRAMVQLEHSHKRAAVFFRTVLKSAIANAQEDDVPVDSLYVSVSKAEQGPTIKRFQPKDRGRAHPIMKRTSHLVVSVDVRAEENE